LDKNASKRELNGRKLLRREKPGNSEVLVPDDEDEEKEEEEKEGEEEKHVHSVCSIHYKQFTVSSFYCHRLCTKVDVFQISVAIMYRTCTDYCADRLRSCDYFPKYY
jgi:hypothetical protein